MDLPDLIPLWRVYLRAAGRSDRTIASYTDHLHQFAAFLGETPPVTRIQHGSIVAYQTRLAERVAPKTHALALTAIRSFCRFLVYAELREDDPTTRIVYPDLPRDLPRPLPPHQIRALLVALAEPDWLGPFDSFQWKRNRRVIYLMLYAGLRISEVARLRRRDMVLERRVLVVRGGKGNKDRSVPLHAVLWGELRLVEDLEPMDAVCGRYDRRVLSPRSLEHVFERWVPGLGLGFQFTAHQLRHTFITELIAHGANVFNVQLLAGHEDPKTTARYYKAAAEHLRSDVERLPSYL